MKPCVATPPPDPLPSSAGEGVGGWGSSGRSVQRVRNERCRAPSLRYKLGERAAREGEVGTTVAGEAGGHQQARPAGHRTDERIPVAAETHDAAPPAGDADAAERWKRLGQELLQRVLDRRV